MYVVHRIDTGDPDPRAVVGVEWNSEVTATGRGAGERIRISESPADRSVRTSLIRTQWASGRVREGVKGCPVLFSYVQVIAVLQVVSHGSDGTLLGCGFPSSFGFCKRRCHNG